MAPIANVGAIRQRKTTNALLEAAAAGCRSSGTNLRYKERARSNSGKLSAHHAPSTSRRRARMRHGLSARSAQWPPTNAPPARPRRNTERTVARTAAVDPKRKPSLRTQTTWQPSEIRLVEKTTKSNSLRRAERGVIGMENYHAART